jgi:CDGSH-type Zn-finger protein
MDAKITLLPDGPLKVDGAVSLLKADGEKIEAQEPFYLCRCGHSGKKPFCDGSHKREGFKAA